MADEADIQRYIDDIIEALSDSTDKAVNRDEIEKEFKKFIEYGVPPEHTKQTLMKKHSGGRIQPSAERTLLVDLKPNQPSIHILCRVVTINEKDINSKGEQRKIFFGILGDESGTIPFTAWKDFQIQKGDVLDITNAYSREWQGAIKINLGDRTVIEKTDETQLPEIDFSPKAIQIKDLRFGLGTIEITVRILELTAREVDVNGQKKQVFSGLIADETGKAQFTSWHDFKLKEGNVLKITGAYVKFWKGIPQVTFDDKATVQKLDQSVISKKEIASKKIMLSELVERNGGLDVEVEGTIIEIRKGSGIVYRCPDCNRVLINNTCTTHGNVTGTPDLRMKLVLDDGTGSINCIIGREQTEQLLGKTLIQLQKTQQKDDSQQVIDLMNEQFFGQHLILRGNALGDDFGVTLIVREAQYTTFDITTVSEQLTQELEDLL